MPKIRTENLESKKCERGKTAKAAEEWKGAETLRLKLKRDIGTDYKNTVNYFKDIPSELDTCMILWLQNKFSQDFTFVIYFRECV